MQNLADTLADDIAEELAKPEPVPFRDASTANPQQRIRPVEAANTNKSDQIAALFRAAEHVLRERREKLAKMEQSYHQLRLDIERTRSEIAMLSSRMGYGRDCQAAHRQGVFAGNRAFAAAGA